jgi:hypothetical protein
MEVPDTDGANSSTDAGDVVYAYKPSLMGAPFEFRLAPDALEWRRGGSAGRAPYGRIRRIRLGFRPMTMQNYRFLTEVWITDGPKLQIASTSWKSLVEHERFDAAYRAFVTELCRRAGCGTRTDAISGGVACRCLLARAARARRRGIRARGIDCPRFAGGGVERRCLHRGVSGLLPLAGRHVLSPQPAWNISAYCGAGGGAAEALAGLRTTSTEHFA